MQLLRRLDRKMINDIRIETIEQLDGLIWNQKMDVAVGRNRCSCLYRGLPDKKFHLATSLKRNCKQKKENLELSILRNFAKYAETEDSTLKTSIWRQMIVGQHHGLPTRLLDWSYSPLVALHFATSGMVLSDMEKSDCLIWQIDIDEMNSLLPVNYREKLIKENAHLMTTTMLDEILPGEDAILKYDSDMGDQALVLLEPPSIDQRIINQYSYFSVIPSKMENGYDENGIESFLEKYSTRTVKYTIKADIKWQIRDMLDNMNINERIAFPGLDGLSKWLTRHYYVK